MNGRNIEALDTKRRSIERQSALQLQQCLIGAIVCITRTHHVAHKRMTSIALTSLEQPILLTTLRTMEHALAATLLRKPLPYHLGISKLKRHVNLGRNIGCLVVVALYKASYKLLLGNIKALIENKLAGTHRASLAHDKHACARNGFFTVEANKINVHARRKDHLLAIIQAINYLKPALNATCTLKIELCSRLSHILFELSDKLTALT